MTSNGLVPLIRYRDVAAAVDWLAGAFGFEKRSIITDPDGTVAYAELSYGRGIVMLGPVGESVLDSLLKQPDELGGMGSQSVYVAVADVEGHFKKARDAGADIVLEFGSDETGDRAYAARDPEGHVWNFGAYSPWPDTAATPLPAAAEPAYSGRPTRGQSVLGGAVAALAIASIAGISSLEPAKPMPRFAAAPTATAPATPTENREAAALKETLARETHARQEAARTAAAIREELSREKAQRLAAETARRELERKLAATPALAAPTATVAASPPQDAPATAKPADSTPTATAAAPPLPTAEPPATTGSLGTQTRDAALQPTAEEPQLPVSVGPPALQEKPASTTAATAPAKAKPKAAKPRTQAQKKSKPSPKKSSGDDPFFMYD
ncbi:MAG: hypothetical protein B7Y80_09085 [Hyphomicrobium sp. 32-62-53]|nr:MAG: hypothetical protein B7Z29_09535 [Hyphomicrobium sp. 12-62-95]OYY00053.1 MAG: hypothetical protein B7Y80_09085 [Hyphomicrobium sp. 32-62-53]